MPNDLAPIALFVYNRPAHTQKVLEALRQNDLARESHLYVYSDGPKLNAAVSDIQKIREVREIIRNAGGFLSVNVIEQETNKGLANSVINGVTDIVDKHGKIIVLEDDLLTHPGFLQYMNQGLKKYKDVQEVNQIAAFTVLNDQARSSYFLPVSTSWGWATWKHSWNKIDFSAKGYEKLKTDKDLRYRFNLQNTLDYSSMLINQMEGNKIDSWAIRLWWNFFINEFIVLYPDASLVTNIGFDGSGTHCDEEDTYSQKMPPQEYRIENFPPPVIDMEKFARFKKAWSATQSRTPSIRTRILNRVKKGLGFSR